MPAPPRRSRLSRLRLFLTDPGQWWAERYASSSVMHLSAVRPDTWRDDVGPQAPSPVASDKPAE